jgi:hypothetical protein
LSPGWHGVARVEAQIHQDLFELRGVGARDAQILGESHFHFDLFADHFFEQGGGFFDHLVEVDVLWLEDLATRVGEQLPGESSGAARLVADFAEEFGFLAAIGDAICADFGPAHDCADYIVEVMRDAARKFAERFELFELAQPMLDLFLSRRVSASRSSRSIAGSRRATLPLIT